MRYIIILCAALSLAAVDLIAQVDTAQILPTPNRSFGPLVGYHYCESHMVRIGVESGRREAWSGGRRIAPTLSVGAGIEGRIGSPFIASPYVSVRFRALLSVGFELAYYTDFRDGGLVFRPTIGLDVGGGFFGYGYDVYGDANVLDVSRHSFIAQIRL